MFRFICTLLASTFLFNAQSALALTFDTISGGAGVVTETNTNTNTKALLQTVVITDNDFTDGGNVSNQTVSITISDGGVGTNTAELRFGGTPTFSTNNNVIIQNIVATETQINFDIAGDGTLNINQIPVYLNNSDTIGQIFETWELDFTIDGIDNTSEPFYVDTVDYANQIIFSGTSGGNNGDIFKVGDSLSATVGAIDYSSRGNLTVDLNSVGLGTNVIIGDHSTTAETTTIIADNDDNLLQTFPAQITYTGTTVSKTFTTPTVKIDNQPPAAVTSDFNWFTYDNTETILGIEDAVTLNLPAETTGDTITFSSDLSALDSSAIYTDQAITNQSLTVTSGNLDQNNFSGSVTYTDNVGNTTTFTTNEIPVDNTLPLVTDLNILSIKGGQSPAKIGDFIDLKVPVDVAEAQGQALKYSIDLTPLGDAAAGYTDINTVQSVTITAGSLNGENFSPNFTVTDKAGNQQSFTANPIVVDNKVPTFDLLCGGYFSITQQADLNNTADITNGLPDSITFTAPDNSLPNCDFETYSIDLSPLSGSNFQTVENGPANGHVSIFTLIPGNLDSTEQQFVMTITDANGNSTEFNSGPLNIDNQITSSADIIDQSRVQSGLDPYSLSVFPQGVINARININQNDISSVSAYIEDAASPINLTFDGNGWTGPLLIYPGNLVEASRKITFTIIDDAGNTVTHSGTEAFKISNNNIKKKGGSGGSLSTSRLKNRANLPKFIPSQTPEFYEKNWTAKKEQEAIAHRASIAGRLTTLKQGPKKIKYGTPRIVVERKNKLAEARELQSKKFPETQKLAQKKLMRIAMPQTPEKKRQTFADDTGDFKLQSTLNNLKGYNRAVENQKNNHYRPLRDFSKSKPQSQLRHY